MTTTTTTTSSSSSSITLCSDCESSNSSCNSCSNSCNSNYTCTIRTVTSSSSISSSKSNSSSTTRKTSLVTDGSIEQQQDYQQQQQQPSCCCCCCSSECTTCMNSENDCNRNNNTNTTTERSNHNGNDENTNIYCTPPPVVSSRTMMKRSSAVIAVAPLEESIEDDSLTTRTVRRRVVDDNDNVESTTMNLFNVQGDDNHMNVNNNGYNTPPRTTSRMKFGKRMIQSTRTIIQEQHQKLRYRRKRRLAEYEAALLQKNYDYHTSTGRKKWMYIIPIDHPFKLIWDVCTIIVSCIHAYKTHIAIRDRSTFDHLAFFDTNDKLQLFLEIWFMIDIVLNFITEHRLGNVSLRTISAISARYLTTWFVIDIVSLIPGEWLFVRPVIQRLQARNRIQKWLSRTKAIRRVTRKLVPQWNILRQISVYYKRHRGIRGVAQLIRTCIRYIPKYILFLRNMKAVVAVRILRQWHYIRKVYYHIHNTCTTTIVIFTKKNNTTTMDQNSLGSITSQSSLLSNHAMGINRIYSNNSIDDLTNDNYSNNKNNPIISAITLEHNSANLNYDVVDDDNDDGDNNDTSFDTSYIVELDDDDENDGIGSLEEMIDDNNDSIIVDDIDDDIRYSRVILFRDSDDDDDDDTNNNNIEIPMVDDDGGGDDSYYYDDDDGDPY